MTPFLKPRTMGEVHYNKGQAGTQVRIEQTFGILRNRCVHLQTKFFSEKYKQYLAVHS